MILKLKEIRTNRNTSQRELARILNISEFTYSHYETEYAIIPIKHLIKFSKYFNVSIDYIFDFINTEKYLDMLPEVDLTIVANRLKEFRKDQKLTQEKLAKILNIGKGTIADYERGRYLIATPFLYGICKKYHISADYLLGKTNNPKYLK